MSITYLVKARWTDRYAEIKADSLGDLEHIMLSEHGWGSTDWEEAVIGKIVPHTQE